MSGNTLQQSFPNLNSSNFRPTSPATRKYNCIAWATGDALRWWWPDPAGNGYWPPGIPRQETISAFVQAYGTLGYVVCPDGSFESNYEKIALFAITHPGGNLEPTHASLQLANGLWTSKLGDNIDIEHDTPNTLDGPAYGTVVTFLKRPKP